MTLPASFNLKAAAQRIIDGPALICFEGDSLYSTATPRMQQGIAQHWRVKTWTGWVAIGGCQHWDVALNGPAAGRTLTTRGNNWYTQSETVDLTVAPVGINEILNTANAVNGGGLHRMTLNDTARQWFPGGDPFSNVALNADFIYFADALNSIAQARFRGRRSDDSAVNNFDNVNIAGPEEGALRHYEVAIPVAVNSGSNLPSMDILAATDYDETNLNWWPVACRIYRPGVVGTQACFLTSSGGFTVSHHNENDPVAGRCSDARRKDFYDRIGRPNVFWISLGTNNTDYASEAQWRGLLETMISNRRAIMNALGVTPLFVLESPYDNDNTTTNGLNYANAMYALAQSHGDVAFVNTHELAVKKGIAAGLFLSGDNIHQVAAGATYYPALTWAALAAAYSGGGATKGLRNRWVR